MRREAKRRKEETAPSTPTPITRSKKVSSLEVTPPHLKHSMATPPVAQQKKLRSQGGVFCSHFGKGRHKLYRGYFFCHECDLWDLESPLNPKLKRSSVRYRCKAAHESFIHPTDKRCSKYVPSKNLPLTNEVVMDDHDDDDDDYIHMLASGHVSAYLFYWKNLYRHSQQGWEAFNSLLKTFFFRRTQRGGSINGGKGTKTRLVPIAKWLQRRIVWLCGHNGNTILEWCNANAMIPISQSATQEDDDNDVHKV